MATVLVNPTPNAVATPAAQTICSGSALTTIALTGNTGGTLFNWTRDNTVPVTGIAASGAGNISGSLTNTTNAPITVTFTITPTANGCPGTPITATVLVNPTPNAVAAPASQTICSGAAITTIALSGNVAGTVYNWTRDNTVAVTGIAGSGAGNISGSLTNTTAAPITVTFTITPTANGCPGAPITATVLVNPTPNAVATPAAQTICSGAAITTIALSGNVAGTVYNWTRDNTVAVTGIAGSGAGNISGSLTNTTAAPITVTFTITPTANGCPGAPITATVLVNPTPNAVATPSAQTICTGSSITTIALTSNTAGTVFNWTRDNTVSVTGIATSGMGNISGALTNTTAAPIMVTFIITPTANGCPGTATTATVIVNPNPSVNAVANMTYCAGSSVPSVVFTSNVPGAVFSWSRTNEAIGLGTNSGTGNVPAFTATNATGGPLTSTFSVVASYTNGSVTCTGTPIQFTITVNPNPTVTAVANMTYCAGSSVPSVVFTSNVPGAVFSWSRTNEAIGLGTNSGTGNVPTFTATNVGNTSLTSTFSVVASYTNNGVTCTGTPIQFAITVNPNPTVNAVANMTYCAGSSVPSVVFTSNVPGAVFSWSRTNEAIGLGANSGTGNVPAFTATNATGGPLTSTFSVVASYTNGGVTCTGTPIQFTITVNPNPTVNAVANMTYCDGSSVPSVVFASNVPGAVFSWSRTNEAIGLGANSGTGNVPAFTATNATGGPLTSTFSVVASYTNNGVTCTGTPIQFTITVNPNPTVTAVANMTYCAGNAVPSVVFTSNVAGAVFSWSRTNEAIGLGTNSGTGNVPAFTATNTGNTPLTSTFSVVASYTNNGVTCTGTPIQFTITINPTPTATATPASQTICSGTAITTIVMSGNLGAIATYNWTRNNTATVTGIAASGSGNISGTLTNTTNAPITVTFTITPTAFGCTGTPITATVLVNPTPLPFAVTGGGAVCTTDNIGVPVGLSGSQTNVNYQLVLKWQ
ncbi:MAG: hypothetical protein IPL65_10015 [Lewinellaceae bacterium]|nr:hypothetical protein [Lewinellaceae bacterium]